MALGQAATDDHATNLALPLEFKHLVDGGERLGTSLFDEAASVDDDEIGFVGLADQLVTVELQQSEHPLAVDRILRAPQANKGIRPFRGLGIGG